jgi:hypothetical protein
MHEIPKKVAKHPGEFGNNYISTSICQEFVGAASGGSIATGREVADQAPHREPLAEDVQLRVDQRG